MEENRESWDGVERRHMPQCESHLDMVKSIAIIETTIVALDKRINGSLASIEKHMDQGIQWRIAIIGTAITLLIQFVAGVSIVSRYGKQIEINTRRLDISEEAMSRLSGLPIIGQGQSDSIKHLDEKIDRLSDRITAIERRTK